jgi:hypothetical protein
MSVMDFSFTPTPAYRQAGSPAPVKGEGVIISSPAREDGMSNLMMLGSDRFVNFVNDGF